MLAQNIVAFYELTIIPIYFLYIYTLDSYFFSENF